MSRRLWLLIEWLGESDVFSNYGVVNTDCLIGDENNFDVGKTILVPNKNTKGARRAKILRISDKKRNVKELKILLEKQDSQMKNVLTMCINTLKDMKTNTMILDHESNRAEDSDSSSDDDPTHEQDLNFTKLTNKLSYNRSRSLASRHHNLGGTNHTPLSNRRPLVSSTPFPESAKLTFDQGTQTDEILDPNIAKVEQLEALLKRLYQQFLSLIGEARANELQPLSMECSETEVSEMDQQLQQPEEVTIRNLGDTTGVDASINTSHADNRTNEDKTNQAKRLCIRRASAQTTNTGLPNLDALNQDSDMVPLGGGTTKLPVTVINGIDWSSYTTATRQLLKAIFPRKVLATHSLTGKQSPAFTNKPPKKALDAKIVNDIVDTVSEVCGVSKRIVRSCITTKCTDEAKLYRNRQLYKQNNESRENQENTTPSSASSNEIITKKE